MTEPRTNKHSDQNRQTVSQEQRSLDTCKPCQTASSYQEDEDRPPTTHSYLLYILNVVPPRSAPPFVSYDWNQSVHFSTTTKYIVRPPCILSLTAKRRGNKAWGGKEGNWTPESGRVFFFGFHCFVTLLTFV